MRDLIRLAYNSVAAHKLRSALSMLGIAIGIASVILLTSIGEGTRRYIVGQFAQFGTNIISVTPGKSETLGIPGVLGGTTRKLTIDDAAALQRISGVEETVANAVGSARAEANGRGRDVFIYGVTPNVPRAWRFSVRQGSFWSGDPRRAAQVAVLGPTLKRELFGEENALGRFVRIGGSRFRVIGIMESKGQFIGFDIDDAAYIPVASAMRIFNLAELNEIHVVYSHAGLADRVEREVRRVMMDRHGGTEDFTITTQKAMLSVFGNVMNVITLAVGAIAGISLLVGSIGILTMMWIAVGERTQEIGLVRAIGATRRQVQLLFLTEAAALATLGGAIGVLAGMGIAALLRLAVPGLPVHTPLLFVALAVGTSTVTGLLSGVLPARRAAALDPIEALRTE